MKSRLSFSAKSWSRESHAIVYSALLATLLSGCGGGGTDSTATDSGNLLSAGPTVLRQVNTHRKSPTLVESAQGTTVPSATSIVDSMGAEWTVSGGVIYRNGSSTI